jgi:glycosyltransferase involved in cell wall biosynthesis
MKKDILFIIESSETGGAESVFAELIKRIDRKLYTPHVALLYKGWLFDRLKSEGTYPHLIPSRKGGFDFRLLKGIETLIRKYDIDLIHSHLFTTNVYASASGALTGVPVISTFHGTMDVAWTDRLKKLKWQAINCFSSRIVFVSQYLLNYFVVNKLARGIKSQVVYNGIDIERFRSGPDRATARRSIDLPASSFVIGCVGDMRPAKDYTSALLAATQIKKIIPDFKLVIVGTMTELHNELMNLRHSLGLGSDIQFLDFRPDIENVFPAFDVYLSSSMSEGFSLTVVEAMAAGLPVIATRSGGPEEIVLDGETGLLVDVGAPEKIAAAIETLYRSPEAISAFGRAGLNQAKRKFSIQRMVDGYQTLYSDLGHN